MIAASLAIFALSPAYISPEKVVVPMKMRGAMPGLDVMVNGTGPHFFALDTGGQGSARADSSLVKELDLTVVDQISARGASGKPFKMDRVVFDKLSIGSLSFSDVPALSRDYNTGVPLPEVKGMIGFNIFKDHLLTLDYPGKKIIIDEGKMDNADGKTIFQYEPKAMTLPSINVELGSEALVADIDSGNLAGAIVVPWTLFQKLKLKTDPVSVGKARSAGGEIEIMRATLDGSLKIGKYEIQDVPVTTMVGIDRRKAVIGAAVLQNFVMTFDQKNGRVSMAKKGPAKFQVKDIPRIRRGGVS
jgi:hypothetical protein